MHEESLYDCVRKECGMKKKALSIIIPVYNVEAYLEQCVKSILDQSTPEVEVINLRRNPKSLLLFIRRTADFLLQEIQGCGLQQVDI